MAKYALCILAFPGNFVKDIESKWSFDFDNIEIV